MGRSKNSKQPFKYYFMKKLILTSAFSLVGVIAVSAQSQTQKPAETANEQAVIQAQKENQKPAEVTVDTSQTAKVDATENKEQLTVASDSGLDKAKPAEETKDKMKDATKEGKKMMNKHKSK